MASPHSRDRVLARKQFPYRSQRSTFVEPRYAHLTAADFLGGGGRPGTGSGLLRPPSPEPDDPTPVIPGPPGTGTGGGAVPGRHPTASELERPRPFQSRDEDHPGTPPKAGPPPKGTSLLAALEASLGIAATGVGPGMGAISPDGRPTPLPPGGEWAQAGMQPPRYIMPPMPGGPQEGGYFLGSPAPPGQPAGGWTLPPALSPAVELFGLYLQNALAQRAQPSTGNGPGMASGPGSPQGSLLGPGFQMQQAQSQQAMKPASMGGPTGPKPPRQAGPGSGSGKPPAFGNLLTYGQSSPTSLA